MDAAMIAVQNEEDCYLILKRAADDQWMPGAWNFPGGKVDPDEHPRDAAVRECEEEAGFTPEDVRYLTQFKNRRGTLYVYTGVALFERIQLNSEHQDYVWIGLEEVNDFEYTPYVQAILSELLRIAAMKPV